jgi:hypothetical protein
MKREGLISEFPVDDVAVMEVVVQHATALDALCNINRHGELNLFAETLK